jgi:hypothetical protein
LPLLARTVVAPDQAGSTRQIRSVVLDFEICRTADLLMQQREADNAKLFAAQWADKLLAKADFERTAAPAGGFAGT